MVPMNWKQKLLDEIISQKTFFGILFVLLIVFVPLTETNAKVFDSLIYAVLGASALKSIGGGMKAMAAAKKVEKKDGEA